MLVVILDVNVHIFVVFYLMGLGLGTGNWELGLYASML